MRTAILLFSLCAGSASAGSAGFGQAAPASPPNPLGQSPWTAQGREFGKLPDGYALRGVPPGRADLFQPKTAVPLGDASIDPQMLLHPTARDLGTQPPGMLMAQNLYPGLKFQPIGAQPRAPRGGLLSTTWPKLKIEEIPVFWPHLKTEPVGGKASSSAKIVH
jgi:hypothetical protein